MITSELRNKLPKDIVPVADFHWGFDPGILMTARMCQLAMKIMNFKRGDKDIYVCSDMYRCHVDSIQVYTGCTLGSGRLSVRDFGKNSIIVYNKKTNVANRFFLKSGYPDIFTEFVPDIPKPELGKIMGKIAFSIINLRLEDLVSFEAVELSNKFRDFMLWGEVIEVSKDYYKAIGQAVNEKQVKIDSDEIIKVNEFIAGNINQSEENLLSYIKAGYDRLAKGGDRFDIYAVSEGGDNIGDATQALFGLTYGNKHLLVTEKSGNGAITLFSYAKKEGIRYVPDGYNVTCENVNITLDFKPNYPAVDRIYCEVCNELVFDSKEEIIDSKRVCSECARDCFEKVI
jgi:formylmethanofuran dehydrogenase subunit E